LKVKLPGKPDIVFPTARIAVFIDGDFWHGNGWRARGLPSFESQFGNRADWWSAKIRRNMARDCEVNGLLSQLGWTVLRYWESEVLADPNAIALVIAQHVREGDAIFNRMEVTPAERRRLASVRKAANREVPASPR
jgi:DNA mismatch endonuclease, patch repair protein